jgi:putative ATP-dependent endonuclease of the OLD family
MQTCGAWKSVLQIMLKNRAHISVMLLDQDCTCPTSSGCVTDAVLEEIGYPLEWKKDNCFYIGTKEFEDAFDTTSIIEVLNTYWPRQDGDSWELDEIDAFRSPGCKFSKEMISHVSRNCVPKLRQTARKTDFAEKLAHHCNTPEKIPQAIHGVFARARHLAGI